MIPCFEKYAGLYLPPDMIEALTRNPQAVYDVCNGVGSTANAFGRLTYHLIPSTLWGLSVEASADIHDWMYSRPSGTLADKQEADRVFLNNMLRQIAMADSWLGKLLGPLRRRRALAYYEAVNAFGGPSFWSGKNRVTAMYGIQTA